MSSLVGALQRRVLRSQSVKSWSKRPLIASFSSAVAVDQETDVLIVGGGVVGTSLADLLRRRLPNLSVGLVEAGKGPVSKSSDTSSNNNTTPHPRSYALSPSSLQLLQLGDSIPKGYYDSMQIWEYKQPACLSFSTADLPLQSDCLGAVVEDHVLVRELWSRLHCSTFCETKVTDIQLEPQGVRVHLQNHQQPQLHIKTKLLVAADGANSLVRKTLGVPVVAWDYGQVALTFTVQLKEPMPPRAFQRFLPTGPLALLPTYSKQHAIVVWSTTPACQQTWQNHPDLVQHINQLLQQGPDRLDSLFSVKSDDTVLSNLTTGLDKVMETLQYGPSLASQQQALSEFVTPPTVTAITSPQFAFPLTMRHVSSYTPHAQVCLVGDAAHTVHPLAGQGLNLGLQDVACLVDTVAKASDAGMDVTTFLADYHTNRHAQVSATLAGLHAIQQVFGVQSVWAKHAKSLGMNLIQNVGPLRSALVQVACQGFMNASPQQDNAHQSNVHAESSS